MRFPGVRAPKPLLSREAERQLSARQLELLDELEAALLSEGLADLTMAEIATLLGCSLRTLLPEAAELKIDRHRLPAIRSLNFVLHGLLEEGVAASTRQDGQAKSLGEWLRARVVEMPESLSS